MRKFKINGVEIGGGRPYIISELGGNHQGNFDLCKRMISEAHAAGADAVKLQKRTMSAMFTKKMLAEPYNSHNAFGATYGEHREALEFTIEQCQALAKYATDNGITLFWTAFDEFSAHRLAGWVDVPAFKIASGDLTNIPLIKYCASWKVPMIISTGGGTMQDIQRALKACGKTPVAFLHCVATYPNQPEEVNLAAMDTMRAALNVPVGWSCHAKGPDVAKDAASRGADIIEKHFTMDNTAKGTDHALSLEPHAFMMMVDDIRKRKLYVGDGKKRPLPQEAEALRKMAKSVHIVAAVAKGEKIKPEHVGIKCPGGGIPPYEISDVIGRVAVTDLSSSVELTRRHYK